MRPSVQFPSLPTAYVTRVAHAVDHNWPLEHDAHDHDSLKRYILFRLCKSYTDDHALAVASFLCIFSQVQKLKSTYVDGMLTYVKDGLLKTRWDHTAAATGRLTSACPNLQAVPRLPVTLAGHGIKSNIVISTINNNKVCMKNV